MSIEVKHNTVSLPYKAKFKVTEPDKLEILLNFRFENNFDRGMRLRMIPDKVTGTFEIGARDSTAFNMAMRFIKSNPLYRETLRWSRNRLIENWREKKYTSKI